MQGISRIAVLAALAAQGATTAQAQDEDGTLLGTITLTASTEAIETGRTGASVTVVTEEDLKAAGDTSVATLLARLPGVSMTRNGGLGTSTAIRLRGLSGPYIGVRIDGIDVADPSGTQCAYDFGSTTMGGISRIEVLRGSQSALYGSEAVGGVVDITSWRPTTEGTSAEVAVEAGSDETYTGLVSVGLLTDRVELAFTASRTTTQGISAYAYGTEDDAFRASTLTSYGSYQVSEALKIGANGIWRDSYLEFDGQTGDTAQTEEGKLRGGRVFAELSLGAVTHELSFAHTETERYYPLGFTQLFDGQRDELAYTGRWDASGQVSLNWGLQHSSEEFGSDAESGKADIASVFAELLYAPTPDLDLSLALRQDDHDTFGGNTSARAALAWRPGEDWVIRAVASTGFRAPSLYELYSFYGDTGLQPETSRSFELGAEYLFDGQGSLQATLFDTRIEDKIGFDGGSMDCESAVVTGWSGCYAQIPGTTRTRGVELVGSFDIAPGWMVYGNYTYSDVVNEDAGVQTRLARVPRHDLTLGVEGQIGARLTGVFSVQHVADVVDDYYDATIFDTVRRKMPDYTIANLTLTYEVNDAMDAYFRVENLFDESYQTVHDYGQPGRQVFVGLRAAF